MAVIAADGLHSMTHIASRRNLIILTILVTLIVAANIVIFVPYFLNSKQMLTSIELKANQQQLVEAAEAASQLCYKAANQPQSKEKMARDLQPLQQSVDSIILDLQRTTHPVELDGEVRETLKLAEVLSFTMRSLAVEGAGDSLLSTKTAQIFQQSAHAANQLKTDYSESDVSESDL